MRVIPSKSYMHRALICASLADKPTVLHCPRSNRDIWATAGCLSALGAEIREEKGVYTVFPVAKKEEAADLCCEESGSTLRFMLPVTAALGRKAVFHAKGRLSARPLSPLYEELVRHGVTLSPNGVFPLSMEGQLTAGDFTLDGSVSSQFFTGLLLGLPLLPAASRITVSGRLESAPYVALTCAVMKEFGVEPVVTESEMLVSPAPFRSPGELYAEGDWSNAAFWMCARALGSEVEVIDLSMNSMQGDRAVMRVLDDMRGPDGRLVGTHVDASDIPDLVPILSVVAAAAPGTTRIYNAARLRLKESDRIETVHRLLGGLGADVEETEDSLLIHGGKPLIGRTVDSYNDHRIAMSAAIASILCKGEVTVTDAEAVNKSYPRFWREFYQLTMMDY